MKLKYDRSKDEKFKGEDSTFGSQSQQDDTFVDYYSEEYNHNFSPYSMKQSNEESSTFSNTRRYDSNSKYSFNEDATSHSFDDFKREDNNTSCHGSFCGMTWHSDFEPKSYSAHHEYNDNREEYFGERGLESTFDDCRDSYEEYDDEKEVPWSSDEYSITENEFTEDLSMDDASTKSILLNTLTFLDNEEETSHDPSNDTEEEYSVASTKTEVSEYRSNIDLNALNLSASKQYASITSYESYMNQEEDEEEEREEEEKLQTSVRFNTDSSSGHSYNNSNISVNGPMSHDLEKVDNILINNRKLHSFPKSARSLDDTYRCHFLSDQGTRKFVHSASSHSKNHHNLKSGFVLNEFEGSNIEVCIDIPKSPNKDTVYEENLLSDLTDTLHDRKKEEMMLIQRLSFDDQSTKYYDLLITAPNTTTFTGQCSMALIPHQQDTTKRAKTFQIKSVIYNIDHDDIEEDNRIAPSLNWMASDTHDATNLFGKQKKSPFCLTHVQPQDPIHQNSPCKLLSERFKLFRLRKGLKQTKSIVHARKRFTPGIFTK